MSKVTIVLTHHDKLSQLLSSPVWARHSSGVLVGGGPHFCITPVPSATSYQVAAQQLGAATHLANSTATRLAQTTASSTAMRFGMHAANCELIVGRNYAWSLSSESARQAIAQLTWEELVLAYSPAR